MGSVKKLMLAIVRDANGVVSLALANAPIAEQAQPLSN